MKNLKYFPFERSRYFYGKLLTVNDFETEQKYGNDKRRMLNRFLYGTGVVCGMNVVRVDDRTISVEMGLALDFAGREIVIDSPMICKLDMIEGYDEQAGKDGYLYLCLAYQETESEPVHSIAGAGARSTDAVEYNKYKEGYRLFLSAQEPEHEGFVTANYYEDSKTIYWGNGIRIKQCLRRFVDQAAPTVLSVKVENMGQQQAFAFDYDLQLTCLQYEGKDSLHIHFDEKDYVKAGRYQLDFVLKAMQVEDAEGSAEMKKDSFSLAIGGGKVVAQAAGKNICRVCSTSATEAVIEQYYRSAMEDIVRNTYQQSIYLAKISFIQAGASFYIEQVEPMPFQQYVFNNTLAAAMHEMQLKSPASAGGRVQAATALAAAPVPQVRTMAQGSCIIDLGIGGPVGQRFFSAPIAHTLGLGPVFIGLSAAWENSDDAPVVCGSPEVFDEQGGEVFAELAALVNVTEGTFQIGLRLTQATSARQLRVYWTAMRDSRKEQTQQHQKQLFIKPDICELDIRETHYFEAVFENVSDTRVRWSVREPQGGEIDQNGMYTAPNVVGVYEIVAESVAYKELVASTYVVVRDPLGNPRP